MRQKAGPLAGRHEESRLTDDLTNEQPHPEAGETAPGATRSGFVALLGAPNAGKSTLVNQLVGTKVSIVTHKVQTTRALVRGIAIRDNAQIVFVDTPGVFNPKRRLDRAMVRTAWGGAKDADIVLPIVDAQRGISDEVEAILERLKDVKQPKVLLLNKVDQIKREKLLGLTQEISAKGDFERVFMISALTGSGCDDLMAFLAQRLPEGPWYYPEDQISDLPLRQLAAEITREKLFLRLHQEIPYASTVETELWETRPDGSVRIEQTIYVERDSQKAIVLGHKGETVKAIGQAARKEIAEAAEQKVHLFLFVKVRENWGDDPERYREMGLDYSS
ncbi:GTPase Era [Aureimonas ureilytica]|uniref:GTPase Era n=1 Tax=Aureimonas ureilytica TaxID=401562 RepID=UPI003CF753E4